MKTFKKIALVLLSVAMLFTLTSCGGNSVAFNENQLTSKISEKLSNSNVQLSYNSHLNQKLVTYLDVYRNSGSEAYAIRAAGLNSQDYRIYATTLTNNLQDAASVLSGQIQADVSSLNRPAKYIGYARASLTTGGTAIFALVQFAD